MLFMQNKLLAAAALSLLVFAPNAARAEGKDGVAAVVNGEKITVAEMKQGYEDNAPIKEQVSFDVFYDKALDVYVNGKLLYLAAEEGYFAGSHRLDNSDVWEIRDSSNSGPRIYYVAMPNRPDTYLILAVGDKNSQQSIQKRTGDVHLAEKRLLDYHLRLQKGTWRDSPEGNMFSRIQNKLSTQKKRGVNGYGY